MHLNMADKGLQLSKGSALSDAQISRLQLFHGVNPNTVRSWVDEGDIKQYPEKIILLDPDVENSSIFILLEGEVSIHLDSPNNDCFAMVEEGDLVGEVSVLDGAHPGAYVKTISVVKALVLDKKALFEMIDHVHGVARNLLYLACDRLRSGANFAHKTQRLQKEYEEHANIDVLTGLYNRRWLNDYFRRTLARYDESSKAFSVILVDVDHFKIFNDKFGHIAGDHALKAIAKTMLACLRPTDVAARYGGEEFLLILPNTNLEEASAVAERVRNAVAESVIVVDDDKLPNVSISLGITNVTSDDTMSAVVVGADDALYKAKANGRNCSCVIAR